MRHVQNERVLKLIADRVPPHGVRSFKSDHRTGPESLAWAVSEGLVPHIPKDNELFIDIDDKLSLRRFTHAYDLIRDYVGIKKIVIRKSRRKVNGKHIVVTLKNPVTVPVRIALQAILGSDPRREAHCIIRFLAGEENPTMFFEKGEI